MLDLNRLSSERILEEYQKVLKIVLKHLTFQKIDNDILISIEVPMKKFEQEGLFRGDIESIINRIAEEEDRIIQIDKKSFEYRMRMAGLYEGESARKEEAELKNHLFLGINDKNKLERLLKRVNEKLGGIVDPQLTTETQQRKKAKSKKLVEFIKHNDEGRLKIEDYSPLIFQGLRCKLIDFFYNNEERKAWKNYKDIKEYIKDYKSETIRKAIEKINKRVARYTKDKIKEIIESKLKDESNPWSPLIFRWKL